MTHFLEGVVVPARAERVLAAIVNVHVVDGKMAAVHDSIRRFDGSLVTGADAVVATFKAPSRALDFAFDARSRGHLVGAGIHVGECEAGMPDTDAPAFRTAEALASSASPGDILITATVRDLVAGTDLRFEPAEAAGLNAFKLVR
jgi:class 3 adenylate cyclase